VAAQSHRPKRSRGAHGGGVAGETPSFRIKPIRNAALLLSNPQGEFFFMQRVGRPAVSEASCFGASRT
jgi:hypothetical protein